MRRYYATVTLMILVALVLIGAGSLAIPGIGIIGVIVGIALLALVVVSIFDKRRG